ncbi:hypothetical protein [Aporhodopirellula aestuarii]|uniref:Uncharacterized protein n=1 Tax=Aporhodopirellula aestuarii TaxID=2950107 RepID=A0ABT0U5V6_9BACT|nr:hypothetical protein [Aporhodopirellula aestuarii]MCM2372299.1 hypothetical protein [Aporhodopirellula aestuarii]
MLPDLNCPRTVSDMWAGTAWSVALQYRVAIEVGGSQWTRFFSQSVQNEAKIDAK